MTTELEKQTTTMKTSCNVVRNQDEVHVTLEMPGVGKDNLDVKIEGDQLIVEGKRSIPELSGASIIREIRRRDYRHLFTLDDSIDRNKVEAKLTNGILELTLKVKEAEKPRKIKVVGR